MIAVPDRRRIRELLGGEIGQVQLSRPEVRSARDLNGWQLHDLLFQSNHGDAIPAYWVCPAKGEGPVPALLYCHAHGDSYSIGRGELLDSRPALQGPYAADFVERGYAVLCLEMPCFGERMGGIESALSKAHHWHGRTLFGRMLAELVAGIDFLAAHPAVDAARIGAIGFSMGGTHAWWLAALEPRLKAAVSMCCFADMACLIEADAHDGHGAYMTVPGLLRDTSTGRLAGLAAPTPQLFCVGLKDWSTPAACFGRARDEIESAYNAAGCGDALEFYVEPEAGHEETPAMRERVLDFLSGRL